LPSKWNEKCRLFNSSRREGYNILYMDAWMDDGWYFSDSLYISDLQINAYPISILYPILLNKYYDDFSGNPYSSSI
jgi:hypothetical protein